MGASSVDVRLPSEIRLVDVEALLPYARNSKTHPPAQIEALAANMQRVGFTNPLLIAQGMILAGHGRLLAAKKLGLTRVPCIDLSHLSEEERRAQVIWDNRSGEAFGAGWDLEMLKLETDDLRASGFDLESFTGFAEEDLAKLFEGMVDEPPAGESDPDDVPDVPDEPASRLGDVWCIGEHRVMCGSSLEPRDWDVLMAGDLADVVWTDPPYNVDIGGKNDSLAKSQGRKNKTGAILNDSMGDKAFYEFLLAMYRAVFDQMKPGAPIYVFHADSEGINFRTAFRDAGFKLQSVLSWKKSSLVLSRWDHHPITEPCLYGWKPGAAHKWYGGRKQTTFSDIGEGSPFQRLEDGRWRVTVGDETFIVSGDATVEAVPNSVITEPKPAKSELHPTMKPTNLVHRQLRNSARPGDVVADAFGGSGSTAVAAHQLGMRARLMELDPKYVDVIVRRLEMFTGARAVHAVTGEAFPRDGEVRQGWTATVASPFEGAGNLADVF
jgi:DNA modification methylase